MGMVFGKANIDVAVWVDSEEENMGILEANYNLNPNRIIEYKMIAVDHTGKEHQVYVINNNLDLNLTEFEE